jgi:hypothetical protein
MSKTELIKNEFDFMTLYHIAESFINRQYNSNLNISVSFKRYIIRKNGRLVLGKAFLTKNQIAFNTCLLGDDLIYQGKVYSKSAYNTIADRLENIVHELLHFIMPDNGHNIKFKVALRVTTEQLCEYITKEGVHNERIED